MLNNHPVKMIRGTELEIDEKKYNISPGLLKVFTNQSYEPAESMTDTEKLVFRDILRETDYYNRKPTKRRLTGHDRYIRYNLDKDVREILYLDSNLKVRGVQKNSCLSIKEI